MADDAPASGSLPGSIPAPAPGIYSGVPFDSYRSWDAMNASTLRYAVKSPKHLAAAMAGELETGDTPDKVFGRAVHCRLLEPERYREEWTVAEPCGVALMSGQRAGEPCGATAVGRTAAGRWVCGRHTGGQPLADAGESISAADAERVERVAKSVRAHDVVNLLRQTGGVETSIVWQSDGLTFKARLDKWIEPGGKLPGVVVDVKTALNADPHSFQRAMADYHYPLQAAFYAAAVESIGFPPPVFVWLAVEKSPPFDVLAVQASDRCMGIGRAVLADVLRVYRYVLGCRERGIEPHGYSVDLDTIDPPGFYCKRWEAQCQS